jgi:putative ABC transport system ATP-binding protein
MSVEPIIRLTGIVKRYGTGAAAATALNGLDLTIDRGEFASLMGPSGSGKTTLLNLVAGLDTPDAGQVVVNGTPIGGLGDRALADLRLRTMGLVFQSFNLLPALTVERNVAWPLQFAGFSRGEVRDRTAEALRRVGVEGCETRRPAELSGGEQQRVAIARAIATAPSLLLADEPTGNLDSRTGQTILDLLRGLNQTDGVTVVMVTHSVIAAAYGDRTLELQDGRIVRDVRTPASPHLALADKP